MEAMIDEFSQEAAITKRVLERVPEDQLSWRPHSKSMTLGQLALHVASLPKGLTINFGLLGGKFIAGPRIGAQIGFAVDFPDALQARPSH